MESQLPFHSRRINPSRSAIATAPMSNTEEITKISLRHGNTGGLVYRNFTGPQYAAYIEAKVRLYRTPVRLIYGQNASIFPYAAKVRRPNFFRQIQRMPLAGARIRKRNGMSLARGVFVAANRAIKSSAVELLARLTKRRARPPISDRQLSG